MAKRQRLSDAPRMEPSPRRIQRHLSLGPLHPTRPIDAEPRCERRWSSIKLACVAGELSAVEYPVPRDTGLPIG